MASRKKEEETGFWRADPFCILWEAQKEVRAILLTAVARNSLCILSQTYPSFGTSMPREESLQPCSVPIQAGMPQRLQRYITNHSSVHLCFLTQMVLIKELIDNNHL